MCIRDRSGVALPLVRRVFGNIVAQELVSVQPMNLPSGLVFYLDFKYGTSTGKFSSGDDIMGKQGPNSPSGSSAPFGKDSGFYGAGRYGYSINLTGSATIPFGAASTASLKDIDFDSELSASVAYGSLMKVTASIANANLKRPDKLAIRAWSFSKSGCTVVHQFSSIDDNDITLIVSRSTTDPVGNWDITYAQQPNAGNRGDFED